MHKRAWKYWIGLVLRASRVRMHVCCSRVPPLKCMHVRRLHVCTAVHGQPLILYRRMPFLSEQHVAPTYVCVYVGVAIVSSLWAPNQQEGQEAAAHIALLRARGTPSSAHIHAGPYRAHVVGQAPAEGPPRRLRARPAGVW